MSKINLLLRRRLQSEKKDTKAAAIPDRSGAGSLAVFSKAFNVNELGVEERRYIEEILEKYSPEDDKLNLTGDLSLLLSLTSEVKAINNQAAILHGERIKKAQEILKRYRDGAFTAWLTATYGNRQTPYNFLQYYEFHQEIPKNLHQQLEAMPRQAIYTLASRSGNFKDKKKIVKNYDGETKMELISHIREKFPLSSSDKRKSNTGDQTIKTLSAIHTMIHKNKRSLSKAHKEEIRDILKQIEDIL
ncbi:MAG: CT583 family protein [Waddliaceae bacterium]|nr:CT583 family protein [Waddliaceae bacterium]MBT3579370.1 CT583 family protein [Waddliaceae bacterium]MBT4444860.1 CT583 family protein [Waddliaceae bacterium]MBT6928004.1 CT583 family protein [Waddliaceae bacterium]MBT7461543.1 CT583 family protein [Waddliaceae bacterium]